MYNTSILFYSTTLFHLQLFNLLFYIYVCFVYCCFMLSEELRDYHYNFIVLHSNTMTIKSSSSSSE